MEEDKALHPLHVGFFRSAGIMLEPDHFTQLI